MTPSYVPVIAAKKGEFRALESLGSSVADRTLPLFELPPQKADVRLFEKPICRTAVAAGKAWQGRPAFLDISKWRPDARTENGVHVLEYAISQFASEGVRVNPVVGYDRWGDVQYRMALTNIRNRYPITPCIRFDREAIRDDMRDDDYFSGQIDSMLVELHLQPSNCYALLDFRDVSATTVPDMVDDAENAVRVLRAIGFRTVIVVGGSMPATVNGAVENRDDEGCIARVEMLAWKTIFRDSGDVFTVFGDYSIRNPDAAEGVIALDANAKIRYTIENQFFVVRGHTKREDSLTVQHRILARKLVRSIHYAGPQASWGDSEIQQCALGTKEIREATSMIAIDTNHHISTVVNEVFEYQTTVRSTTTVLS